MAPPTGFEPVTQRLTVVCSTTELRRNIPIYTFTKKLQEFIIIWRKVKLFLIKKLCFLREFLTVYVYKIRTKIHINIWIEKSPLAYKGLLVYLFLFIFHIFKQFIIFRKNAFMQITGISLKKNWKYTMYKGHKRNL